VRYARRALDASLPITRASRPLLAGVAAALLALTLLAVPGPDQTARAATEPGATFFAVPPPGGAVQGVAGTSDPAALANAQLFDVLSISTFDVLSQQFFIYIPGAPAVVNTLTSSNLKSDSIVWLRRNAADGRAISSPANAMRGAPPELAASAQLRVPRTGGATQGLAGVSTPTDLVDAVPFGVTSVTLFDFDRQRFLVYVPGAPPLVNTLGAAELEPHSIVWMRRKSGDVTPGILPGAVVSLAPSSPTTATGGGGGGFSAPPPPPASGGGGGGGGFSAPPPPPSPTPTPTATPTANPSPTPTATPTPSAAPQVTPDGGSWAVGVNNATVVVSGATAPADVVAAAEAASGMSVAQIAVLGASGWQFYVPGIPALSDLGSVGPGTVSALVFTQ
jgi:hypothetical protein